jgi:hypothetical protein
MLQLNQTLLIRADPLRMLFKFDRPNHPISLLFNAAIELPYDIFGVVFGGERALCYSNQTGF